MNWEDEAHRGETSPHIKREDIRHPKHNCIKQIVVVLWAFQLLSAAVGVDCQEAKEGAESEKDTFLTVSGVLCFQNAESTQQRHFVLRLSIFYTVDLGFFYGTS